MAQPVQDVSQLGIFRTKPLNDAGYFVLPWNIFFQQLQLSKENAPQYFFDTHAKRTQTNASNVGSGSIFYENDRTVAYINSLGVWVYLTGIMQTPQSALPQDLGANDSGFLAYVMNYAHLLVWNGTGWTWGPGEVGSGYTVAFVSAPSPLIGWHAANGATLVPTLQSTGAVKLVTVPTVGGSYYRT